MPKKVHSCAKKLQAKGRSAKSSWKICAAAQNKKKRRK